MRSILVVSHHNIRNARMRKGLSVGEAAQRAEMAHGVWLRIEKGMRSRGGPQMKTLRKMAAALEVDITELYEEQVVDDEAHPVAEGAA